MRAVRIFYILVLGIGATVGCSNDDEDNGKGKGTGKDGPLPDFEMVQVSPGTFTMGSPETEKGRGTDETQHTVTLTQGFDIGTTEVTQELYEAVTGSNPSKNPSKSGKVVKCPTCPVNFVSWFDAVEFCNALSERQGHQAAYAITGDGETVTRDPTSNGYRLPTEAEWEYAARAGESHAYAGSDDVDAVAWYDGNSDGRAHPVGTKSPNAWGLYDMSGNVREYADDCLRQYPRRSKAELAKLAAGQRGAEDPVKDPICSGDKAKATRSGSFKVENTGTLQSIPAIAQTGVARRGRALDPLPTIGFRIVRNAALAPASL